MGLDRNSWRIPLVLLFFRLSLFGRKPCGKLKIKDKYKENLQDLLAVTLCRKNTSCQRHIYRYVQN